MALSDLELLQLVDRAEQGRKGDQGVPGIGIRTIRQDSPEQFTVVLTDGRTYDIKLTPGAPGETGPAGTTGARGERGPAGRDGLPGASGRDGTNGMDGEPGTAVDSALVNASGDLLIGLTDGNVINCGRVVGPAGAAGESGPTGLPGERGADGNTILSGFKAPNDVEDGKDGDFYLDLSSPQYDFYGPKKGGAWGGRTTFLKQPPATPVQPMRSAPVGSGGGGSGGSGGQDAFEIQLPAGVQTEIGRFLGEQGIFLYKAFSRADVRQWGAGQINLAATEFFNETEFSVAAELFGPNGDLDLIWTVERSAGNPDLLVVSATSAIEATVRGRLIASV